MYKKYLLILLVVCILSGLFYVTKLVQNPKEEPENPIVTSPTEEIPVKGFKDLELIYHGQDQKYRMDTILQEIAEESNGNINFHGLDAVLKDGESILQQFATSEGVLFYKAGVIELLGPIRFEAGKYQLFMNKVNVDLNQGRFHAKDTISLVADEFEVESKEMSADFQLNEIHFTGRPRLTVKKGG